MEDEKVERNIAVRVVCLLLWLPTYWICTNMLVGAVVGAMAGTSARSYKAGYQSGEQAAVEFFTTYGVYVLLAQVLIFIALAYFGKLPGVSKYKPVRPQE